MGNRNGIENRRRKKSRILIYILTTMEELIAQLAEILEIDELDITKKFTDYDEWDSLAGLSILALLDSDYNTTMTGKEVAAFESIEAFCKEVLSRQ